MGHATIIPSTSRSHQTSASDISTVAAARRALTAVTHNIDVLENGLPQRLTVIRRALGPIRHGRRDLWLFHFEVDDQWRDYYALVSTRQLDADYCPIFRPNEAVLLRIDSGCLTGQVFLDATCECREQLHRAIELIEANEGLVISVPGQDGRGLGLDLKLGTLHLDRAAIDTVDAAKILVDSEEIDRRTYGGTVAVLMALGLRPRAALRVLTNNQNKIRVLAENGYVIEERVPLHIPPTEHTIRHLAAKRSKLGHLS